MKNLMIVFFCSWGNDSQIELEESDSNLHYVRGYYTTTRGRGYGRAAVGAGRGPR